MDDRLQAFQHDIQSMVNNFHIEIIRQFEIQKTAMESLVQDFLLDEEDEAQRLEIMQGQGGAQGLNIDMDPDIADGDDVVFFDKYGD